MNPSSDEGLNSVFNSLVDVANNARLHFTQGSIPEALYRLQDVKRTIEYLEHRLPEQERAQRSSGRTDLPQAGLAIHAKTDRQHDQGRGSISHPPHTSYHGPPYSGPPQHLPSFKGPSSGVAGGHGQGYTSGVSSGGSLSRSGTASDPGPYQPQHHGPGPSDYRERPTIQTNLSQPVTSGPRSYGSAGRDHQEDSRDSRDSRRYPPPLTAPVSSSSSSSSSSLWSSPRAPVPQQHAEHGSSPGGAAGPFRQRHTSLPQVLNYNTPGLPSPTREHPPPPLSHHSQHQHHHHHQLHQPQHPPHQYQAQHSHQSHHSSSQPQPPPHHQPHYSSSVQHQQQHGVQQQQHGRTQYQQAPSTSQSTFHQGSPRIPHRYDGQLSSPRGSYFQESGYHDQPTSPRTRRSSDRVPETIEKQLYYGEQEDRRHVRRISQGGPSPAHTPDHRARISSLVHPQDARDLEGNRPGMQTPPRRESGGGPGQSGPPSSSSSSLLSSSAPTAAKSHLPFTSNGIASGGGGSAGIHASGPSPPQQHLPHLHHPPPSHHHHPSVSAPSPTTAAPRGSRHSLTVTTLGNSLGTTSSNSSIVLHASVLPASANTATTVTTRGDNTGSRTQFHAPLEPEVIARLDDIFFKFLQRICSDLKSCDSKGDHIHQPLMAKKMQRLEASTEFRPFKFRIQAFTNAFHDSLILHGLTEDILPLRKVKVYLWKHRYISRFNEDGKKQKSKGNHVWNIEARRIAPLVTTQPTDSGNASSADSTPASGTTTTRPSLPPITTTGISSAAVGEGSVPIRWEFREYSSRIAGQIIKFARVGIPYVYSPRIWDAQMSCPDAKFSSPWLPGWLKWKKGELKGIPGPDDESCEITVIAEYVREGEECKLEMSFPLTVSDPSKEGELMDSQNEQEPENENEVDNEDEDELEEDDDQDGEQSNGQSRPRAMAGRRAQGRQRLLLKKPRLSKQPRQQQPLHSQAPTPSRSQQNSPPQHRPSYSSQGAAETMTTRQAVSGGEGEEEQGSSYDDDEDDDMDQEMMDEEDEIDDDDQDDDEMDYVDGHTPPRKKARERRSLILVKDSQDPKRRKHIK